MNIPFGVDSIADIVVTPGDNGHVPWNMQGWMSIRFHSTTWTSTNSFSMYFASVAGTKYTFLNDTPGTALLSATVDSVSPIDVAAGERVDVVAYKTISGVVEFAILGKNSLGLAPHTDIFHIAIPGQVEFTLDRAPSFPQDAQLSVNGLDAVYGTHFTISGNLLTWLNNPYALSVDDYLVVHFF